MIGTDRLRGTKYPNPGGIDRYWKYRKLISIEFSNGKVISAYDVSDISKRVWQIIEDNRDSLDAGDSLYEYKLEKLAEAWLENPPWWITSFEKVNAKKQ